VEPSPPRSPDSVSPPRAFTQGLGQIFQITGVLLFLIMMFICCGSGLLSKDFATHSDLTHTGWRLYSSQRALTISLFAAIFFGIALAGIGLGLQAENRAAPIFAIIVTLLGSIFWIVHAVFTLQFGSIPFMAMATLLACLFVVLLVFAISSFREMRRDPPPQGHELLPKDYKIPYSHYHDDPPEVRLARELDQRRERLAVQQKELEMLEEKLKRKMDQDRKPPVA
jgi:lysylphosphatidylglycerol synthetase-like protein (DUF2156 family)